ncbi:MAG: nucleotidyltransferase family protein [Cypionkella sp.]
MTYIRSQNDGVATHLQHLAACLRGELPNGINWDEVIRLANDHLLGPRLYRSVAASAHAGLADPEAMTYLAGLDGANRERNARLLTQLAELSQALAAQGITPILLKGGAELCRSQPQGTSPRMLRDLDVLIHDDEATRTDGVLRAFGYDTFPEDPGAHSTGTYFRPSDVGSVDVHVRLPMLFAHLVPPEDLVAHTEPVPVGGGTLRVPDASLQFVINLGHEMLHDEAVVNGFVRLGYLVELTDLASDASAPLDQAWILGKCGSRKFRLGLELQARMAHHLGLGDFPEIGETRLGGLLHRRRLVKMAHPWLGAVEWQAVRWAKDLRHLGKPSSDHADRGSVG